MIEFLLGNKTTPSVLIPGYPNQKKNQKKENSSLESTNNFSVKWCESIGMTEKIFLKIITSVRL